jgi:hypothetical protein
MELKAVAAAVALVAGSAAGGGAYADIERDNIPQLGSNAFSAPSFDPNDRSAGGVGEIFVSIVARDPNNPANNRSLVLDTGITSRTLVDAYLAGTLMSLPPDVTDPAVNPAVTNFLTDNASKAISFSVTAVHNPSGFHPLLFIPQWVGFLTTSPESASSVAAKQPVGVAGFNTPTVEVADFINSVNQKFPGTSSATNDLASFSPGEFGFHDNNWGHDATFGFETEGSLGSSVGFWFIGLSNDDNALSRAPILLGEISLSDAGALSFQPVPLPAAVWLLGGALAGLAGVTRRRKVA